MYCVCSGWLALLVAVDVVMVSGVRVKEVAATVGSTATLSCVVDIGGDLRVMWLGSEGEVISVGEDMRSADSRYTVRRPYLKKWNLQLRSVRRSDEGNFTCLISTSPPQKNYYYLKVVFPPTIRHISPDVSASVGDIITLVCRVSGKPPPKITWNKFTPYGQLISLGVEGRRYRLVNVNDTDAGTYQCHADNGVSPAATSDVSVNIKFAPQVEIPHQRVSQQVDHNTLLQCMVTANPHDQLYWTKGGHRLTTSSKYRIDSYDQSSHTKIFSLYVFGLQQEDFGTYECVAENSLGKAKAELQLYEWTVGHVRVIDEPRSIVIATGMAAMLNCSVKGMTRTDSITWWWASAESPPTTIFVSNPSATGSEVVHVDSDKYEIIGHYNLLIKNVDAKDAGKYACELSNRNNYTAYLTVVDSQECDIDGAVTVQEGQMTNVVCQLNFTADDDAVTPWRVTWRHDNQQLASVNQDTMTSVRRVVSFRATHDDAGKYSCEISSSNKPRFNATCSTTVTVQVRQCGALSEVVHGTYEPWDCTTRKQDSGSVCTLTCHRGYYPDTPVSMQCTKSDQWWAPTIAQCEARNSSTDSVVQEDTHTFVGIAKSVFGLTVGGLFCGLILLFLLVLCVVIIHYKRKLTHYRGRASERPNTNGAQSPSDESLPMMTTQTEKV